MTFEKVYDQNQLKNALSDKWQRTSEVATIIGCTRRSASNNLLKLYDKSEITMRKVKSPGRLGFTREWKQKKESNRPIFKEW